MIANQSFDEMVLRTFSTAFFVTESSKDKRQSRINKRGEVATVAVEHISY